MFELSYLAKYDLYLRSYDIIGTKGYNTHVFYTMKASDKKQLSIQLRSRILELAVRTAKAHVHIGSCMSSIDMMIETLLFQMKRGDKFILSKGHASLALYTVLAHQRKISQKQLDTYFYEEGTHFGIHTPSSMPEHIPLATGSLGHGLSFASGVALGYRMQNSKNPRSVFCLMSDGECNEGAVWEAAQFASHNRLDNLYAMIDKNGWQALGKTKDVLGDGASVAKWKAFGFNTLVCDGHDFVSVEQSFTKLKKNHDGKPNMLICKTLRGRGLGSIENKLISNYAAVTKELYDKAILKLKG